MLLKSNNPCGLSAISHTVFNFFLHPNALNDSWSVMSQTLQCTNFILLYNRSDLTNKVVFEPAYDILKFMVQNGYLFDPNLIQLYAFYD